jgi:hypothetical protein
MIKASAVGGTLNSGVWDRLNANNGREIYLYLKNAIKYEIFLNFSFPAKFTFKSSKKNLTGL